MDSLDRKAMFGQPSRLSVKKRSFTCVAVLAASILPFSSQAGSQLTASVEVNANGALIGYETQSVMSITINEQVANIVTSDANDPELSSQELVDLTQGTIAIGDSGAYSIELIDRSDELYALQDELNAATENQSLPFDMAACMWGPSQIRAKDTGEFKRVNRSKAYRHTVTSSQVCTVRDTGQQCRINWQIDAWMSDKPKKHDDDVEQFFGEYAEELGVSAWLPRFPRQAQTLMSLFPNRWEQMLDKVAGFKGTPLEIDMNVSVNRSRCISDAQSTLWDDSLAAARRAGASGVGQAVSNEAGEALGNSVGGQIGSSVVGSVASSFFGNVGKSQSPAKAQQSQADVPLYRINWASQAWKTAPSITVEAPSD